LQTAFAAGCRDPFCLRWLAAALFAQSELEAARPVLEAWQAVEPRNTELQKYLDALEPHVPRAASALLEQRRVDPPAKHPARPAAKTMGQPISSLLDGPV
jgi:hypothetical protein